MKFKFSDSEVHLVSTVPGIHPGRSGSKHLSQGLRGKRILYGPQRVNDVVDRLSGKVGSSSFNGHKTRPWLPPGVLSSTDRLVIQTTSLGAKWNSQYLEAVAE